MENLAFLLDTNVLSELMKTAPDKQVIKWFNENNSADFYTSSITQAEIYTGIAFLPNGKRKHNLALAAETMFSQEFAGKILDFDSAASVDYALIRAHNKEMGHPVTTDDAMIGAIAKTHKLCLVTRNTKEFIHYQDLKVINPFL